ncbi:MAG: YegS/Rv2252/BmrU family lipid kinase [Bacteroidetes bacterium]|nr:YegS/Rv2252/BmrU family lipid kinase [Bacteroidota bacterium]
MQRRFIYFINPISGTKGKLQLLEMIKIKTAEQNIPFEILHTNAEGNYNYLKEKIRAEKITDVIVCGGDGSINQIGAALVGADVNVGIIPMGSGNGLAFAAKIPKQANKALSIIFNGHATAIDAFFINNQFSCMLCGIGFDAQVAHDFAKQKKRGLATYVKQSTKNFIGAKPYPFNISVNGDSFSTDAFFISIANSNQFGNNFTIAPGASLNDGLLDIVIVNKSSKMRLLWNVWQQIRKGAIRPYTDKQYQSTDVGYFQTAQLTIHNPQLAPLHIDGDPAATAPFFEIAVIPGALRLLLPG